MDAAATSKPWWDELLLFGWVEPKRRSWVWAERTIELIMRDPTWRGRLCCRYFCKKRRRLDAGVFNDTYQSEARESARCSSATSLAGKHRPHEKKPNVFDFTATIAADVCIGSHDGR